jgi:hypothetical protein
MRTVDGASGRPTRFGGSISQKETVSWANTAGQPQLPLPLNIEIMSAPSRGIRLQQDSQKAHRMLGRQSVATDQPLNFKQGSLEALTTSIVKKLIQSVILTRAPSARFCEVMARDNS